MLQDVKDLTASGVIKGLNTQYNLLSLQKDQSPNMMDVKVNYDGSIEKRLGSNTQNTATITGGSTAVAGFSPTTTSILTSFVSYWPLNEVSGDRSDKYGTNVFQQSGGVLYASGIKNQAALFIESSAQFLRAASSQAFTGNPAFSYAAWFYLNSTGGTVNRTILAKRGVTSTEGGGIVPDANDVLVVNCDNAGVPTQFLDSSTAQTPKIITANGNATQLPTKLNKSAGFFNGTTDYVVVPDSTDWDFGTGDYNVEFFFNMATVQTSYLLSLNGAAFSIYYSAGHFYVSQATVDRIDYTWTPTANTWYHIRARRVSGTITLYVDGVSQGTPYAGSDNISGGTTGFYIGAYSTPASYFSGWMKEFRVIKGTSTTVTVPTTQYIATSEANTVLLMHFDTPATSPLGPAIAFDGTGDWLTLADSADWDTAGATTPMTYEFWVKFDTVQTVYFMSRNTTQQQIAYAAGVWYFYHGGANAQMSLTPVVGKWYHVAGVKTGGGSDNLKIFVDGVQGGTTGTDGSSISDTSGFEIGARSDNSNPLIGSMREIRISNNSARYTSAFTPNQSGFTVDAQTVLYIKGNENNGVTTFVDSETTPKTVTTAGNTVIKYTEDYRSCIFLDSETTPKYPYPVGSAKVDFFAIGSGVYSGTAVTDYISVPDSDDWNFGTSAYTMEVYFRTSTISDIRAIIDLNNGIGGGAGLTMTIANGGTSIGQYSGGLNKMVASDTIIPNIWYHMAIARTGTALKYFLNGSKTATDPSANSDDIQNGTSLCRIGAAQATYFMPGFLDNIRISKGIARYTAAFNPPDFSSSASQGAFEYSLYVGSDNLVTFDVSSSGTAVNGTVKASSFGTVGTGTWYNALCWYDSATAKIGVVVNESFPVIASYTAGIIAGSALLCLGVENTAHFMDGRIDEVGFWTKKMGSDGIAILYNKGSGNTYASDVDTKPWASFDFGASSIRWLTAAAGTGVYASSNLGLTWVNIATDRSASYQYFDRSKNVMILTSEAYDNPLYWAGSIGTYCVAIGNSSPLCKYSINFQGFLILLNSSTRKRSFNYIDENFQLSSTAWLNFDFPSSADDEITNVFILRRYLYVSTRYKIYRVSYVGGNPDWQYVEVKGWGFIPRTAKRVVITNNQGQGNSSAYSIGEVVIGLTYDRKLRIFDGSGDQITSNNVEKDNGMCEFALDKISYLGSGPLICFAEVDPIPNIYSVCVGIGQDSTQTTHFLNYDGRSQALYPYSNMKFNCMCVAESANRQFLMAFDRNGFCHMMNSGNLDGSTTPINDYLESPLMYEKTPSQSSKSHKTDLFFSNTTSGDVYYQDRINFSNTFKTRRKFVIDGSDPKIIHYESVDVPEMYNTYQFRLTSSSGTNNPWRLQRYDHFTKGMGIGRAE